MKSWISVSTARHKNANESFNGSIWDRIPKVHYVSLRNLEFGVYDDVGFFNIGLKSSILIYEQLGMST